jgi:hypothetical protein
MIMLQSCDKNIAQCALAVFISKLLVKRFVLPVNISKLFVVISDLLVLTRGWTREYERLDL